MRNTCSQIYLTPSGRFLYVGNRGHNSIAGFAVDPATGRLTPAGHAPTEAVPTAFGLDSTGTFLFAAGTATGRLASYRVDGETGALSPLDDLYGRTAARGGARGSSRPLNTRALRPVVTSRGTRKEEIAGRRVRVRAAAGNRDRGATAQFSRNATHPRGARDSRTCSTTRGRPPGRFARAG